MSTFKPYLVRFWSHQQSGGAYYDPKLKCYIVPNLNDCFGNSLTWRGQARTEDEAVKKAMKNNGEKNFRLHSVKVIEKS